MFLFLLLCYHFPTVCFNKSCTHIRIASCELLEDHGIVVDRYLENIGHGRLAEAVFDVCVRELVQLQFMHMMILSLSMAKSSQLITPREGTDCCVVTEWLSSPVPGKKKTNTKQQNY